MQRHLRRKSNDSRVEEAAFDASHVAQQAKKRLGRRRHAVVGPASVLIVCHLAPLERIAWRRRRRRRATTAATVCRCFQCRSPGVRERLPQFAAACRCECHAEPPQHHCAALVNPHTTRLYHHTSISSRLNNNNKIRKSTTLSKCVSDTLQSFVVVLLTTVVGQ